MNTTWKTILADGQGLPDSETIVNSANLLNLKVPRVYPLLHLCSLTVTGKDSAKLLQGQLTCNVNEISESKSNFTALCNPKGRVIATFLLIKKNDAFVLVLPSEMLDIIQKRLQMFVLRSDVKIINSTDSLCLLGVYESGETTSSFSTENQQNLISVNWPDKQRRKLLMADAETGLGYWTKQTAPPLGSGTYQSASVVEWRYLDIVSGIPWVTQATSEEFIPQMLNLDKLGGISFNKGCYTGQEIVARTHYLGKVKREMVLAECHASMPPELDSNLILINKAGERQEVVGKVFQVLQEDKGYILQAVIQTSDLPDGAIGLQEDDQAQVNIIPFQAC